jgi:hypothetical protein
MLDIIISPTRLIIYLIIAIPLAWIQLLPNLLLFIWLKRISIYSFIGIILSIVSIPILSHFRYIDTINADSARYFLSALVQSEAAIIAIVITLSLVVVQQASSSYSTRVIEVFKSRNPDFWILLLLYIGSIIYGFTLLINIGKNGLNPIQENHLYMAYFLGFFALFALVPYIWNTIGLLKPTRIIQYLSENITEKNIIAYASNDFDTHTYFLENGITEKKIDDPLLPIVDIITMSLMKYDYDTSRAGLSIIGKKSIDILKSDDIDDKHYDKILQLFKSHFYNIGKLAIYNDDEICAILVTEWFYEVTLILIKKQKEFRAMDTINLIGNIGELAIEKNCIRPLVNSVRKIDNFTRIAFEENLKYIKRAIVISLSDVGEKSAEYKIRYIISDVMDLLYSIIKKSIEEELEEELEDEYEDEYEKYLDEMPDDLVMLALNGICKMGQIVHMKHMQDDMRYTIKIIKVINQIARQSEREDVINLTNDFLKEYNI